MIIVENVTKSFGKKVAVNNLSFCAEPGMITGLIGGNGSGKSTTMRMIATLLKQNSGTITINGVDTVKNPVEARKQIGILLGGDVSLYDKLTARENILYFADLQGMDPQDAEKSLAELSDLLGMNDFLDRQVTGFSRGMRQKVSFARSIIHNPDVLLLDEPSTGLDINSIKEVQDFILFCKEKHKTILLSTHNAHEMETLCDNIVFIDEGKVIAEGEKEELLQKHGCKYVSDMFFKLRDGGEKR